MKKEDALKWMIEQLDIESPNEYNTWQAVRQNRRLLKNSENYPFLSGLELSWQTLEEEYNEEGRISRINRERDERVADTPLNAFLYYIEMGFYPPPEILLAIQKCFEIYMRGSGYIKLEEAFFGNSPKGKGIYAKRRSNGSIYEHFHFHVGLAKNENKNSGLGSKSLSEIAVDFFNETPLGVELSEFIDHDSFLRGYRRWKSEK
jgi:hypothetical protein